MHRVHDVQITKVINGFLVRVGCWTLVFQSQADLLHELGAYYTDPAGTEKLYRERFKVKGDGPVVGPDLPERQQEACETPRDGEYRPNVLPAGAVATSKPAPGTPEWLRRAETVLTEAGLLQGPQPIGGADRRFVDEVTAHLPGRNLQ